jgi:hypothetical protein
MTPSSVCEEKKKKKFSVFRFLIKISENIIFGVSANKFAFLSLFFYRYIMNMKTSIIDEYLAGKKKKKMLRGYLKSLKSFSKKKKFSD